jgi:membrane-associated protein
MLELFHNLTNPGWLAQYGGLYFVALIVFAETGLFIGFFLPGDPLLFIAGMMTANVLTPFDISSLNLVYWILLIASAGILGNYIGYWFGRKSGDMLLNRKDTWLFKKRHLYQAKEFYEKRGGGAIVLARFLPIVRTFAPIVAGVVKMDMRKFSFYNIIGSIAWVGSIMTAGYLLGENTWVKENLEKIIVAIVLLATTPVLVKMLKGRKKTVIAIPLPVPEEKEHKPKPKPKR